MIRNRVCALFVSAGVCVVAGGTGSVATADTIYLKNGRVIHALEAAVDGDRVVFSQHGSMQSIPLALVDRVVDDDRRGAGETPRAQAPRPGVADTSAAAAAAPVPVAADARLRALTEILNGSTEGGAGGADPAQALGLLQALGGAQAAGGADGAGLAALLQALGPGIGGDVGALGADLQAAQTLLPALAELGRVLFEPRAGEAETAAAVDRLLESLAAGGVSEDEVLARAASFGVPAELLRRRR